MAGGEGSSGVRPPASRCSLRACTDSLLLAVFLATICLPLVADVKTEESEKRKRAELPKLELATVTGYPRKFDAWFNDRFGFRGLLIRTHNHLKVKALGISPVPGVIVGSDGWLYYNADKAGDGVSIRDHRGLVAFTPKQLETSVAVLEKQKAWLDERGIAFAVVVCPNKETIYPEHLPRSLAPVGPTTRLDQLMDRMRRHPELPVVDPRPALLETKGTHPVYYLTDTHWNNLGGFVAYREIMRVLERQRPELAPLGLEDFDVEELPWAGGGDLAVMITMKGHANDIRLELRPKPEATVGRPKLGTALVFGDSFLWGFHPYLERHFGKVEVREGSFSYEEIEKVRPDVVIVEVVERYQERFYKPAPPKKQSS